MRLYIGNKNYSSWSLRAWLPVRHCGIPFEEELVPLDLPESKKELLARSPSGRVPCLVAPCKNVVGGNLVVWDTLAIGEYLAETHPEMHLWPKDRAARATARAIAAEMHSGFPALRYELPMNVRAEGRKVTPSPDAQKDIARIIEIWNDVRSRFGKGGPFLFGEFSLADAFYAPVATRMRTYGVKLEGPAHAWVLAILALPAMREWADAARKEPWTIAVEEKG
jgi:glutathione S-transferase